jgi:glycosyltransferase involved in cell wall biosynthesis
MRIAHFAPFAPNACGLYEAARDFIHADRLAGRKAELCDIGIGDGVSRPGLVDDRGDPIIAKSFDQVKDYDLFVIHGGIVESWLAAVQTPAVVAMHGRPLACFRPEQNGARASFSYVTAISAWPRTRAVVTMWSEHEPYWRMFVPPAKLVSTDDPPIDTDLFKPKAKDAFRLPGKFNQLGKTNILIADSWREDIDIFEAACGALRIAEAIKGVRIHFWGVECDKGTQNPRKPWEEIFSRLRNLNALGHVYGRMPHMEVVYRAMDFVLCPHRICVRVMGEALASGVPVLAERGCRYTPYQASFNDPDEILSSATRLLVDLRRDGKNVKKACRKLAVDKFSLPVFGAKLGKIYEAVLAK